MYSHVAIATLNQTVGDWSGNRQRVVIAAQEAAQRGASLLLCPELALSGYSLLDRLYRESTLTESFKSLLRLTEACAELPITVCVGLPISLSGLIYNAAAVISGGQIVGFSCKSHLAHGDVEYEERYFAAWPMGKSVDWTAPDGQRYPVGALIFESEESGDFALEICEDAFRSQHPGALATLGGAELILNPSASWFTLGKHSWRRELVRQRSREGLCGYLYASLLGADNTRLIFDGAGFIVSEGQLLVESDRLRLDREVNVVDALIDLSSIRRARRETGSWRRQVSAETRQLDRVKIPSLGERYQDSEETSQRVTPSIIPDWISDPQLEIEPSLSWWSKDERLSGSQLLQRGEVNELELELALCLGLHDYMRKAKIKAIALALSGGRDSAMVALLVHRMWRYRHPTLTIDELRASLTERFHCAYLATENSGSATQGAAKALASELGATFYDLNIQEALSAHHSLISHALNRKLTWADPTDDITLQNVQARLRGSVIWMIANSHKALLLATSNKSEAAVGYTTMDGDTSGGLSPIADVPKSLVSRWLRWARERYEIQSLEQINGLEPTAELRPASEGQNDEDDLMPFDILDQLIFGFCQQALSPLELFQRYWPVFQSRYSSPRGLQAHIHKFIRLFCFSQWKRERFAVSFRVMSYDLDPKGGGRYPVIQAPFTEELEALDAYVETLDGGER